MDQVEVGGYDKCMLIFKFMCNWHIIEFIINQDLILVSDFYQTDESINLTFY